MRKVFLLAFALFAWNILANAQESDERYIEVTGSSEIEVVPDGNTLSDSDKGILGRRIYG